MAKAKSKSKAAPKKATKKVASTKKGSSKKVKKLLSVSCPDLTNKKDKNGNLIIPTPQERTLKNRELTAYLKQESDPRKKTAARKAWGPWFKGKAA